MQVNSNGVLSFESPFTEFSPREFPFSSPPLIAPFWHDFNPSAGGNISYRQSNDSIQLRDVHRLLLGLDAHDINLTRFYPEQTFIATWDQVPPYSFINRQVCINAITYHNYHYHPIFYQL